MSGSGHKEGDVEHATVSREDAARRLGELALQAEACRRCPLGEVRTQAVFSRGNPEAEVVFVGEAPGYYEDKQGEPFVGAAGQLLDRLVEQKLGLKRTDVYVMNVLKCRPPGNRDPQPLEVEACKPFLNEQLDLIRPRVVVALGNFAARLLTGTQTGISRLRGRRFEFRGGATLIPTFHPAAALRGGAAAGAIGDDFAEIARALEEHVSLEDEAEGSGGEQLGLFA